MDERFGFSLQVKTITAAVTAVSIVIFLLGAAVIGREKRIFEGQLETKARILAAAAAAGLRGGYAPRHYEELLEMMREAQAESVTVESPDGGKILLSAETGGMGAKSRLIRLRWPSPEGDSLRVSVRVSTQPLEEAAGRAAMVVTFFLLFGIALLSGALIAVIRGQVLLPVSKLAEAAAGISRGDLARRVTGLPQDEMGALGGAFNAMMDRLETNAKELRNLNETLELKVRERTLELTAANRELEAFTYCASHDLRAPLRRVEAFSSLLEGELAGRLDKTCGDYLRRIRESCGNMARLMDALLRLSQAARRSLESRTFDLAAAAAGIMARLRDSDPGREVLFSAPAGGLAVRGDQELLTEALENLLGNAWKFTAGAAAPAIELGAMEKNGEKVYYVRDNGSGFDMRNADKLFAPFHRLHSASEFPGSGIGLSIVRRVIERHGGQIWAEASAGAGAVFYFTLPAPPDAAPGEHAEHTG